MSELDALYAKLAHMGFCILRQAIYSGDQAWMKAEIEMLHNVPTLIGEKKVERHRYYWEKERTHYVDWVAENGSDEAVFHKRAVYDAIWREMEPLVVDMIQRHKSIAEAS